MWPHDLKLQRASEHLNELKAEIDGWVKGDGYTISVEPDLQPVETDYEVKAYIRREPGEDPFSLLMGDFLQNARAALDYIAFALGDAGAGRGGMDAEAATHAAFPIVGDIDAEGFSGRGSYLFAKAAEKRLATVAEPARTVIQESQPYYKGGEFWMLEPLWVLHELGRFDRHRFLHLAVMRTSDVRFDPATLRNVQHRGIETDYRARVIEDPPWDEDDTPAGAVIATFTARPANPKEEMHMDCLADIELGFDGETLPPTLSLLAGDEIWSALWSIEREVHDILGKLSGFLPTLPPGWRGPF